MNQLNALNQTLNLQHNQDADSEISLVDIVTFFQSAWKKLLLAAVAGAILGLMGWFFVGKYQAELVLDNGGGELT